MDKEKLSQLQIWEYYKYSELCALLGEPEKQGNSKKAQEKEWARYFEFEKIGKNKGTRYIVDDIYDIEKRKAPSGNSKYIQMIESLLSYVLISYCESKGTDEVRIVTDWKSIAYVLYMCKYYTFQDKIYLKDVVKDKNISERAFLSFMYAGGCYMHTKIDRALNDMVKNKEIVWNEIHVGREYDGTEYGKSHTLTQQEYLIYLELEKDLIHEYAPFCTDTGKGMWTIINRNQQKEFYKALDKRAFEEMRIWGVFPKYEICTRKKLMMYAAERLTEMEYKEAAKKLNDEICAGLRASKTMLCHQKELNYQRNGKKIHIPEKDLVTEQERDYLVGLIHGLDGNDLADDREPRTLQNEMDVYIEKEKLWS